MEKLHNMFKHFSSTITKRKNYDSELEQYPFLPTNQLEQDHDRMRIVGWWVVGRVNGAFSGKVRLCDV